MQETRKNRMKESRFYAGKTQMILFVETGIHYSTISRIECGYLKPTEDQKKQIAGALDVDPVWLFPEE